MNRLKLILKAFDHTFTSNRNEEKTMYDNIYIKNNKVKQTGVLMSADKRLLGL